MAPARPHFFKVMVGDFSKHLRIPPAFLKYIPKEGSQRAILVGPSSGLWRIKLSRSSSDIHIQYGWAEFVKDHSLQEYDFLLFRYNGDMCFTVKIFNKTACEREDAFAVKASKKCGTSEARKKQVRMVNGTSIFSDLKEKKSIRTDAKEQKKGHCSVHGADKKLCRNMKVIEEEDVGEEDGKVLEDYLSFTSTNPFFVTKMKKGNVITGKSVHVPADFHVHLPPMKSWVVLQDPKGRSCKIGYLFSLSGRSLSAGWTAFSRNNSLKLGDTCIFELVGKSKLQVHIFPR